MEIQLKKLKDLKPNPLNPRKSSVTQDENLKKSLEKFGVVEPIVFNKRSGFIVGGHFRVRELKKLGYKEVECVIVDLNEQDEKELLIRLNANTGDWDTDLLLQDWDADKLADWGVDIELTEDKEELKETAKRKLSEKFIVPPFSILDTRQGYWQERKRFWRELINDNGESRFESMGSFNPEYKEKNNLQTGFKSIGQSVSLLDPVLSEIINNWFGLPNSKTFDCFAGDSVFGFVSAYLGNEFTGIELRSEQADLNNIRINSVKSRYICDDGQNVLKHIEKNSQDLLFSCPPYFNLEVYSDLKNDASNQKEYSDFLKILENAFTDSIKCLKENRFAVIVVGDIRDKKGAYRRFVDDIKDIFKINNTILYNSLILIEQIGTKAMTVNKSMDNRKIGKCHQNVLVFFKGDPKKIKEIYPKIEYASEDLEPFTMDNGNEPE